MSNLAAYSLATLVIGGILLLTFCNAKAEKAPPSGIECFPPMHAITQGLENVERIRVAEEAQEHRLEEIRDLLKKQPKK